MHPAAIAVLGLVLACVGTVRAAGYTSQTGGLSDALLLREMVARMGSGLADPSTDYLPIPQGLDGASQSLKASLFERGLASDDMSLRDALDLSAAREMSAARERELSAARDLSAARQLRDSMEELSVPRDIRDEVELNMGGREEEGAGYEGELAMHPSLRDREYMSHGHLLGNMLAQFPPGSSYGTMRIKPSGGGSPSVTTERKTDGVLPAYCNPPNPCPLGYTAADGCEEEFQNTAAFSRNYQAQQQCMCDTEHMFDCPDSTRDAEMGALARSIQNEGVLDTTLDRIMDEMRRNPYLRGEKLPIAAKKGVLLP